MKRLYQGLTIIATAAALTACSSMAIDEDEALKENYPADFDAAVYLEIHPVLMTMQILDYVKAENAMFQASLSADEFKAKNLEDSLAFFDDTVSLHKIYVSPRYAANTEEDWAKIWVEKSDTTHDTTYVTKTTLTEVKLDSLDTAGTVSASAKVFVDSFVTDTAGTLIEVFGKTDTSATEVTKFVIDGTTLKVDARKTVMDTIDIKDSLIIKPIPPGLDSTQRAKISIYNIKGVKNDLEVLDKLPPDTEAAARQFVGFGRDHGWAYRRCLSSELGNEAVDPVLNPVKYPATSLYCDDNGTARKIVK